MVVFLMCKVRWDLNIFSGHDLEVNAKCSTSIPMTS
jgi:hypothetical protein